MDWIILAIVLVIVGCAVAYIIKSKKNGVKCIGCPSGSGCHCQHEATDHEEHTCSCCQHEQAEKHSPK